MQRLKKVPYIAAVALLVYMPFHVFLSQWLSEATGGLDAWKIGKDVLLAIVALFTFCLVWQQGKRTRGFDLVVGLTFIYGLLHLLLWMLNPHIYARSAELGVFYNMRLPLCLVLGYGATLLYPKFAFSSLVKFLFVVSTIVALLGIIQYLLPDNTLTHFGYSLARGARPEFVIGNNNALPRIMSTLRDPNSLGAYLLFPLVGITWLILAAKDRKKRLILLGMLLVTIIALYLTFSRSAWLAVLPTIAVAGWYWYGKLFYRLLKRFWPIAIGIVVVACMAGFMVRNTTFFKEYIIHYSDPGAKTVSISSDSYHSIYVERGIRGITNRPLGHGPGTAGLASIQNPKGSFLTENYYVQIGYEVGVLGLLVFLGLSAYVYYRLYKEPKNVLVVSLLASFWGYIVTNMLLHTWENEAVAAQWWIVAGICLGLETTTKKVSAKRNKA